MTDVSANDLDLEVNRYLHNFDIGSVMPHLELIGEGQRLEVLNQNPQGDNLYYQWLACLVRYLNPKQIVELGPAAGISTIMMATQTTNPIISVDIDKELAWKWMKPGYPHVTKILGDDLDLSIYPKELDLSKTDLWFMDTLHTKEQLTKEIELYKQFWKKGVVVVLDDIRMPELWDVWESLPYDKRETTHPNHYSGFGHLIT